MLCPKSAVVKYDGMKGLAGWAASPQCRIRSPIPLGNNVTTPRRLLLEGAPVGGAELNDVVHHGGLGGIGIAPCDGFEDPAMGRVGDLLLLGHSQADAPLLP